jgi:hypothetical protein
MKWPVALAMSLVFAALGFLGGRMSPASTPDEATKGTSPRENGRQGTASSGSERSMSSTKSGERRIHRRAPGTVKAQGPLAESLQALVEAFNNKDITLPDGTDSELLLFDMAKFSHVLSAIESASQADVDQLRELVRTNEDSSEEADILETIVALPLLSRDIQLRGATALDAEISRALEDPVQTNVEEVLPSMAYTLALQNPSEAEQWLERFNKREDLDELIIDPEELQAAIDKAKAAPSAGK